MTKIISKNTKRNVAKVRKRLESENITIKVFGQPDQTMLAGEALLLGSKLLSERQEYHALQIALQLSKKYSDIIDVHLLKIKALIQLEEIVEAQSVLDFLLKVAPENIGVLAAAARHKIMLGNINGALKFLAISNKKQPENIDTLLRLAECYRLTGDQERAKKCVVKCVKISALKKDKDEKSAQEYRASFLRLAGLGDLSKEQEVEIKELLKNKASGLELRADIAFTLAKKAEKGKKIGEEIKYLGMANLYQARAIGYLRSNRQVEKELGEEVEKQKLIFPGTLPHWLEGFQSVGSGAPIFILGMPRSGTTLIEQMLGSHSEVGQAGESKALGIAIERQYRVNQFGFTLQDYPRRLDRFPHAALQQITTYYIQHQRILTSKNVYIDKELSTFKFVGVLAHLFPQAKFIHMSRSPMDIFLSCYRGAIPGVPETCNIEHLAYYYIYMKKLIGHWQKIYPGRLYILNYAELVNSPEMQIRKVLKFVNLDFQQGVMEFYKRKNIVRTLSVDQVRQQIYTTSLEHWRPFADMLEPARKILERHGIGEQGVALL